MGFFDKVKGAANGAINFVAKQVGSEAPNDYCTVPFKCRDCGLLWYLPKSIDTDAKTIVASPDHPCTEGDGQKHHMRKIR